MFWINCNYYKSRTVNVTPVLELKFHCQFCAHSETLCAQFKGTELNYKLQIEM